MLCQDAADTMLDCQRPDKHVSCRCLSKEAKRTTAKEERLTFCVNCKKKEPQSWAAVRSLQLASKMVLNRVPAMFQHRGKSELETQRTLQGSGGMITLSPTIVGQVRNQKAIRDHVGAVRDALSLTADHWIAPLLPSFLLALFPACVDSWMNF